MERPRAGAGGPQRAELLAALSLALDLGLGQPLEHMLRSCLLAMRLADLVGADAADRETAYYGGLLAWIGCHADSQEFAELFGDDIAFRAASYEVDWRGPQFAALLARYVGSARPLPARAARLASFAAHAQARMSELIGSHCVSAGMLAARLGLPERVAEALAFTFERWDGGGLPSGAPGAAIPLGMRIVHLADVAEVHLRLGGPEAATGMARQRSGTQFDPALVEVFCAAAGGRPRRRGVPGPARAASGRPHGGQADRGRARGPPGGPRSEVDAHHVAPGSGMRRLAIAAPSADGSRPVQRQCQRRTGEVDRGGLTHSVQEGAMTAIEETLPAVPGEAPAELIAATAAEIAEMNGDSWETFEENGVTGSTPVQVEFAFSAPNEEAAHDLAEHLQVTADYDAAAGSPESEFDEWTVTGTTTKATVSAPGLEEWIRRMAAAGYEHGGCQLDGWSAILD